MTESAGTDYGSYSIKELKRIALADAAAQDQLLESSITYFQQGSKALQTANETFKAHVTKLGAAWQGRAATAAVADATSTQATSAETSDTSTNSGMQTEAYASQVRQQRAEMKAVPEPDTSFWGSLGRGAMFGPFVAPATAADMYRQQQKYDAAQQQAAAIATRMDQGGADHASTMQSSYWTPYWGTYDAPPSSLPPVPGSTGPGAGGPYATSPYIAGGGNGGGYSAMVAGPSTSQSDGEILNNGVKGNGTTNPGQGNQTSTTPQGGGTNSVNIPSTTAQGANGPATAPAGAGGPGSVPVENIPTTAVGNAVGGGAAAAMLGGAGLLGAGGVLGGRGGVRGGALGEGEGGLRGRGGALGEGEGGLRGRGGALGEGEGGLRGRGGALGEGEGGLRGRGGALGEGEGGLRGRGGALGEGEGGLRGGSRLSGVPEEELPPGRRGMLRGGVPEGFMGEPVAGEAGRLGGYPGGGAGSRRRDDDEEAPVPDYLVETEDVWGDGAIAAPPVIGE